MKQPMRVLLLALACGWAGLTACRPPAPDEAVPHDHGHPHLHAAPHGGTLVVLGDEEFHLELVLDEAQGRLQCFVLDAHAAHFVRLPIESFDIQARSAETNQVLRMQAVTTTATGEKVGDTALFETRSAWLRPGVEFQGVIPQIVIRGREYRDITFDFPRGHHAPGQPSTPGP
jgi:hypothetical protein